MHQITRVFEPEQFSDAARVVRDGGLVVFPTETVYGIGANALDESAVSGIFRAKGRPQDNPLIVHIASIQALPRVAREISELSACLMRHLSPGALTVIFPRNLSLASAVSAGLDTVGVRIPASPLARSFLTSAAVPVAAPSANQSGRPSPTSFAMAYAEMNGRVDAVLKGPDSELGLESTIVWPDGDNCVHILRPGAISPTMLRNVLDAHGFKSVPIRWKGQGVEGEQSLAAPAAPGTRYRHYSPLATVLLFESDADLLALVSDARADGGTAYAFFGIGSVPEIVADSGCSMVRLFSTLEAYAHDLYRCLLEADAAGCSRILAWLPPAEGIGLALSDRLRRAAGYQG